MKAEW